MCLAEDEDEARERALGFGPNPDLDSSYQSLAFDFSTGRLPRRVVQYGSGIGQQAGADGYFTTIVSGQSYLLLPLDRLREVPALSSVERLNLYSVAMVVKVKTPPPEKQALLRTAAPTELSRLGMEFYVQSDRGVGCSYFCDAQVRHDMPPRLA